MHPITALMLSQALEAERRREIQLRQRRFAAVEVREDRPERPSLIQRLRLPRFGMSAT